MCIATAMLFTMTSATTKTSNDGDSFFGYYSWNWGAGSKGSGEAGENGIAFTGLVDLDQALKGYTEGASWCCPELKGQKMVTVGGGNAAGTFTVENVQGITRDIAHVREYNYSGIVFDVEQAQGTSADLSKAFEACFQAAKKEGLVTAVTTSHSAPYQTDSPADAVALVKSWVASANLDILSPQLYSSGSEAAPQFDPTNACAPDCSWDLYKDFRGTFAPSIVDKSQYEATVDYFAKNYDISVKGFIQWAQ